MKLEELDFDKTPRLKKFLDESEDCNVEGLLIVAHTLERELFDSRTHLSYQKEVTKQLIKQVRELQSQLSMRDLTP